MQTPSAYKDFSRRLCEEFLEEATFLWQQLCGLRDDPELGWRDAAEYDARLVAHLDGLIVCADEAAPLCRARGMDEPAELHVVLRVLCRLGQKDAVLEVLGALAEAEGAALAAAGEALAANAPPAWHDELGGLAHESPSLAAAVAPALARAGSAAEPRLLELLAAADEQAAPAVLTALGRVGGPAALEAVLPLVAADAAEMGRAAAVAALRLGGDIEPLLLDAVSIKPWLILPAALGCGPAAVGVLRGRADDDAARHDALLGLGLLGDLSVVRVLYDALADPDHADTAAAALEILTGAELFAEVFVPENVEPDALFDDERAHWDATREAPARADGAPFGTRETRRSIDPQTWRSWLSEHKSRFDATRRYRYGEQASPAALLRTLAAQRLPSRVRAFVCDELKIRYGCNFPALVTMPVEEQQRLLGKLEEWVAKNGRAFDAGGWHRAALRA